MRVNECSLTKYEPYIFILRNLLWFRICNHWHYYATALVYHNVQRASLSRQIQRPKSDGKGTSAHQPKYESAISGNASKHTLSTRVYIPATQPEFFV